MSGGLLFTITNSYESHIFERASGILSTVSFLSENLVVAIELREMFFILARAVVCFFRDPF